MSILKRFIAKIALGDGCWLWTGHVGQNGYGKFYPTWAGGTKGVYAHRFAYELFVGPIAPKLTIDHLCRVRNCVRPAHLEAVTQRENLRRSPLGHAAKTHCPQGHAYDEANTRINPGGGRECRACGRDKQRRRRTL